MTLADALERADLVVLVSALAHLTGDRALLSRYPVAKFDRGWNLGGFTKPEKAEIRAHALELLRSLGRDLRPEPGDDGLVFEIMQFCAGEPIDDAYLALVREECGFGGADVRRFEWEEPPPREKLEAFRVGIIGSGFGGLCAAIRLQQAGIPFTSRGPRLATSEGPQLLQQRQRPRHHQLALEAPRLLAHDVRAGSPGFRRAHGLTRADRPRRSWREECSTSAPGRREDSCTRWTATASPGCAWTGRRSATRSTARSATGPSMHTAPDLGRRVGHIKGQIDAAWEQTMQQSFVTEATLLGLGVTAPVSKE